MKRSIIFLCVFLIFSSFLFADIFVETSNDSITIWNTNVWEHCALSIEYLVDISNDTITIIEHDTMPDWTTCVCFRDLSVTLTGLEPGDYYVQIYRQYSAVFIDNDSLYYIGSISFNYNPIFQMDFSESYYQSRCLKEGSIEDNSSIIVDNFRLINIYPNPFNSATNIKYYISDRISDIEIIIYDIQGREIEKIDKKSVEPGYHEIKWEPKKLSSGNYILKLSCDGRYCTQRALYIK